MNPEIMYMIIGAVITGAGMSLGGLVVKKASSRIKFASPDMDYIKKEMDNLESESNRRSSEIRALFTLQGPQVKALIALLESTKEGGGNGKIDLALAVMKEAELKYQEFLLGGIGC